MQIERARSTNDYVYFVHYNGWSKNWDEWVDSKRILKLTEENLKKQRELTAFASNSKSTSHTSTASSTKIKNGEKKETKEGLAFSKESPLQTSLSSKRKISTIEEDKQITQVSRASSTFASSTMNARRGLILLNI
jgi:mortality factor 4-like protein 1